MPPADLVLDPDVLDAVESAVGERSYQRGRAYARGGRVLSAQWDGEEELLSGNVLGQGALYDTVARFASEGWRAMEFEEGECTCPVGWDCKHVAALVIAVAEGRLPACPELELLDESRQRPAAPAPQAWDEPLRELIGLAGGRTAGNPLAIELSLDFGRPGVGGEPRLMARLMRTGARGGWVNGSLSWNGLDHWKMKDGDPRADHLALLHELYALHRLGQGRYSYYGYGTEQTIELGACDNLRLWSLLDEAARIGLALVHRRPQLGAVGLLAGELVLDLTRAGDAADEDGEHLLSARLALDEGDATQLEPVVFVGRSGHGLVCVERYSEGELGERRISLVRLGHPVPERLRRMALEGVTIAIPAGELAAFGAQLYPSLRHIAKVVSSDGSFEPPRISAPALVLQVHHGDGHVTEAGWGWRYLVGDEVRLTPLATDHGELGIRDPAAEQQVLAAAGFVDAELARWGLVDDRGRPADQPVALTGLETMRFATEALPRLSAVEGIEVEVGGEPADYRDVSDALTIGVATAEIAGERDWFDLGVTISVDGRELPFADVFVALASGESRLLLDDGAHFSLLEPRLQSLRQLIDEARALTDAPPGEVRISRWQASLWSELVALGVVTSQAQAWERQAQGLLSLERVADRDPPDGVRATLRPYQRDGFAWLAALWEHELGGILADDMGLGKTLQALALICHARASGERRPFLVVAPTSVVPGWVAEAARFAPGLRVAAVLDTSARSGRAIAEIASSADVVVTTYTLFRLDAAGHGEVSWAGLVLDEAQHVKNHQAATHRCARCLNAPFKLAITGTPMENNLMELWAILSISAPGLFPDPSRFAQRWARPIERGGDRERLERLRRRIKPLVRRRTKELVAADLPAKQEQQLEVDLHPGHQRLYDTHLQRERQKILGLLGDFDRNRFTILRSITILRQLSLHPGLIGAGSDSMPCAKLTALTEQLRELAAEGHRALVFSQFTGFLAIVRAHLERERIGYSYLDGSTRRRQRVIDAFKQGTDPAFLISLKAGGAGLNLTEADYCFLLDPWWNPATEAQAIDRTHRIGQTRPVIVYRLISRGTIEEKVVALARRKAQLFKGVMDDGDLFASPITAQDIRGLLS